MAFRSYDAPVSDAADKAQVPCPESFADAPGEQYRILQRLYAQQPAEPRIPLPRNAQELWAQHKYSVLARSQRAYREYGPRVSKLRGRDGFDALATEFAHWLRERPGEGDLLNAVQHMWGYLDGPARRQGGDARRMLAIIQQCAATQPQLGYLRSQTALTELAAW